MKAVVDRIVQYPNRYKLTNAETGEVLGTFDFEEVTGTVQQVGTEIDKELFDSIADDLAARVKLSGGELAGTIVTFSDISDTAANVASGDTSATLWGKVKNWFSRLKALAFKNKVATGDFEAGAIKNDDVAADAAIAQSKVSGLMTDYVASISVSGRTVTYKNKNGVNMGSITTQDTTYELASQSSNGLMSSTDKTKLDGIESGAQKNTVLGVKGSSESAYRTGNVNITKANIGLGNVDNTSDENKPVSAATQTALNGKANTSGTYPNMTVGKATNADNAANATKATQDASGNVITSTYATKKELSSGLSGKANTSGSYPNLTVGNATKLGNKAASEYALMTIKTAAEWGSQNPVLGTGVFGFDSTSKIIKIGDGTTAWKALPFFVTTDFITTDLSFSKASWRQIAVLSESGSASKYFSVGDEKTIELTTGEQVTLVILGFNHDDLSDGSGKAGMTIGMKNLLADTYKMNATDTNRGSWDESEMRTSTMATLLSQLPSDLQGVIKQVNKKATAGAKSTSITTSVDKLWLLAKVEVDGTTETGYADEGAQYEYWKTFKDDADRVKYLSNGIGDVKDWFLRSPELYNTFGFKAVDKSGNPDKYAFASSKLGVSFGFCV